MKSEIFLPVNFGSSTGPGLRRAFAAVALAARICAIYKRARRGRRCRLAVQLELPGCIGQKQTEALLWINKVMPDQPITRSL